MNSNSHLEEIIEIVKKIKNTENSYKNNIPKHKEANSLLSNAREALNEAESNLRIHLKNHKNQRSKFKNNETARQESLTKLKTLRDNKKAKQDICSALNITLEERFKKRYELEASIYDLHTRLINVISKEISQQTNIKINLSKSVERAIQHTTTGCYDCYDYQKELFEELDE